MSLTLWHRQFRNPIFLVLWTCYSEVQLVTSAAVSLLGALRSAWTFASRLIAYILILTFSSLFTIQWARTIICKFKKRIEQPIILKRQPLQTCIWELIVRELLPSVHFCMTHFLNDSFSLCNLFRDAWTLFRWDAGSKHIYASKRYGCQVHGNHPVRNLWLPLTDDWSFSILISYIWNLSRVETNYIMPFQFQTQEFWNVCMCTI